MAKKVTIDVEARFIDKMSDEAQDAASSIKNIGNAAEKAKKKTDELGKKKVNPKVDADTNSYTKKIRDAEAKAKKFGRTKAEKTVKANDKASAVIDKVERKSKKVSGKVWSSSVKVKADAATATLRKITSSAEKFAGKTWTAMVKIKDLATAPLRTIKNALFSIKTLIGAIAAGWAAKQAFLDPISVADAYSSAKISFSTLLGKNQGQQMMDDLDLFAKATPFNTTNVISNAQKMLAMGWNAEDILKDMRILGDAAAATGKLDQGLESIVRAMSQIKTKGRLSTEELNQLAEAGIAAKAMLAEQLGYGTGDTGIAKMTEDLEDGNIASDKAIAALLEGMKKYEGMMDSMANETVEGLWSQMKDTFDINIVRRWGQGLQDGAKEGMGTLLGLLDDSEDALASFGDTVYKVGRTISNWLADKLENAVEKVQEITSTDAFQNASLWGKVKMLWTGVIANPFAEWWQDTVVPWWDGVAVPWLAEKAGSLGTTIGKGLSNGLLALLGADTASALEDGVSIGGSFAKGFAEGFDGAKVADAFVDAFGRIWDAMPWWAKALLFGYGATKLGSGIGSIVSLVGNVSTALGSASAGTGLLGFGANAAKAMGAGGYIGKHVAGTGVGLGTSLLGLGSTAGFVYGGTTAISGGVDLYNGYKNDDETAKKAGWWKVGGAGGGAALGAAIGSIIPGVGTLVGAGVGALAGSLIGNWGANKVQEEAAAEARKAEDLANAEAEAAAKAARLKAEMKELAKVDMAKHFGDIALSAEEVQMAVNSMIGQEAIERAYAASDAIAQMDSSMKSFNSSDYSLKKELWLSGIKREATLTDEELTRLKNSAETFSKSAKTYLEDAQYASSESISALMGNSVEAEKILSASTAYYDKQREELSGLSGELEKALSDALSDNIISIDEQATIDNLRSQIAAVMKQIQDDEYQASMNTIKAKYGNSDIDVDTFKEMVAQMEETASDMTDSLWESFGRGSIGLEEGSAEWNALIESTLGQISGTWEKAGNLGLDKLRDKWSTELGIFTADVSTLFSENTPQEILQAVNGMTVDTRASIGEWVEAMKPTTEQIQELVSAYEDLGKEPPEALANYLQSVEFYQALADGKDSAADYISDYLSENAISVPVNLEATVDNIDLMLSDAWTEGLTDEEIKELGLDRELPAILKTEAEVGIDWVYDKFDEEWISPSGSYSFTTEALVEAGWHYDAFNHEWISPDESYSFKTQAVVDSTFLTNKFPASKSTFGLQGPFRYGVNVSVDTTYTLNKSRLPLGPYAESEGNNARGGIWYPRGLNAKGYAAGGMVRGGARLITVAEEGTPEMIIPLGSQRRERALKLFQKTGEMLNVPGFARGGLTTGNQDEGLRFRQHGGGGSTSGQEVHVEVGGVSVEIHVDASGNGNIVEAIKAQGNDIAETVAGILADAFGSQFENTPVRGGVS